MPDRSNSNGFSSPSSTVKELEPTMVVAAADTPTPYFQQLSDVPSELKVVVAPQVFQLTQRSIKRAIRRNATIAMHWLNVPFVDPLISVSRIYKTLDQLSFNYEREHTDSFWLQYPGAMILKDSEARAGINDEWCRLNRKKLCSRFAHYAFQYLETKKLQTAALINLNVLTRLNGTETLKQIASDVRWAYINTRTNMYERFPAGIGTESAMIAAAQYAIGKTTYGADVVSIPLYCTEITGNRGNHSISPLELLKDGRSNVSDSLFTATAGDKVDPQLESAIAIENLMLKMYQVNSMIDGDETLYRSPVRAEKPSSVKIENGATFAAVITSTSDDYSASLKAAYSKLNSDGNVDIPSTYGTEHSQLTKSVWNAYRFWEEYLIRYFSMVSDPYSDTRNIMQTLLNLVAPAMKVEDVNKAVRANKNIDINDLAAHMTYKRDNCANTATLIKFAPFVHLAPEDVNERINLRDIEQFSIYSEQKHPDLPNYMNSVFECNFERYKVEADNIVPAIVSAKIWPHLNPSILHDFVDEDHSSHYIVNTAGTICDPFKRETYDVRICGINGKYATALDYALAYSQNPDKTSIESAGIDVETFKRFASTPANNIVVFDECPDSPFVLSQPIFDPSDIYQCGFNILISANDEFPNEWVDILTDPTRYTGFDSAHANLVTHCNTLDGSANTPAYGTEFNRHHIVNPEYRQLMQNMFVFVGVGIFNHPVAALAAINCNHFSTDFDGRNSAAFDFVENLMAGVTTTSARIKESIQNASVFSEKDTDDTVLPASIAALDVASTDTENKQVKIYAFAPDYPPVLLARQYSSTSNNGSISAAPRFNDITFYNQPLPDDIQALGTTILPRFDSGHGDSGDAASPIIATTKFNTLNFRDLAIKSLFFFIRQIDYTIPTVFGDGSIVDGNDDTTLYLQGVSDWLIALSGHCKAMYAGLRDTIPFWDRVLKTEMAQKQDVASGADFATNDVLVPPRSLVAKGKAKVDYANRRNGQKPSASTANTGSFVNSKGHNDSNGSRKRPHRTKRYSRKDMSIDSDGINEMADTKYHKNNDVNAGNDSPLNMSNDKDQKFIKKSDKSPLSGDDILKTE